MKSGARKERKLIHDLPYLSKLLNIDLSTKRDDLLPLFMGGNKVRKNVHILNRFIEQNGKPDLIITNGGSESNHARVCALLGRANEINVSLVLHGTRSQTPYYNGNQFYIEASGAEVSYVLPDEINKKISEILSRNIKNNKRCLIIPGGGHSIDGGESYVRAVEELETPPDIIVVASGTGATQAGILAGIKARRWKTRVVGISIARSAARGKPAVEEIYSSLIAKHDLDKSDIEFFDQFTCGGYGQYSSKIIELIKFAAYGDGLPLDPVYTGKAMHGLFELCRNGQIKEASKVLFWHTGGGLNLQSSEKL